MPIQQLTIQSNTGVNDDAYITSQTPTSNYGGNAALVVGHDESSGKAPAQYDYRALLRFDVSAVSSYTILSSTLTLSTTSGTGSAQTLTTYRCTQTGWTELGVTWNKYDGSVDWTAAGGDTSTPSATVGYTGGATAVFDTTSLVIDAIANRSGILNCLVDGADTTGSSIIATFASFDHGTAALRPLLTINYLTPETAEGGVVLGGSYDPLTMSSFAIESDGGLILSTSLTNPVTVAITTFVVEQDFSWHILSAVEVEFDFQWDVGSQVLRYYIVEGDCEQPPACETTGFDFNDEKCDTGMRFIQTFAATGLDDLCTKMQAVFLNYPIRWSINRIRRFSRPVYLEDASELDENCNELEDQVYCHVPECFDFCLDEDLSVSMGMAVVIQNAFYFYDAEGGLILEGIATPPTDLHSVGVGGLTLGSSAIYYLGTHHVVMDGGMVLAGEMEASSPDWHYEPNGFGLSVEGDPNSNTSNFQLEMDGGLTLAGTHPDAHMHFIQSSVNIGLLLSSSSEITDLGYHFILDGDGLDLGGSSDSNASNYNYTGAGGLTLGGETTQTSGNWHYSVAGGLTLSNPVLMRALPEGGLSMAGTALISLSIVSDGGLTLGGSADVVSPDWHFAADGIVEVGGAGETSFLALGDYYVDMGAEVELVLMEAQYPTETNLLPLTSEFGTITANCFCDPTPNRLRLSHNINTTSIFKDFLYRNELSLPSQLNLIYNQYDNAWRSSRHYRGVGTNSNEKWTVLFEWICNVDATSQTGDDGPVYPGIKYWKFSVLIKRDIGGNVRESRVLYEFPAEVACDNEQLKFSFKINTNTRSVLAPESLTVGSSIIYDDLGLFSGRDWQKKPNLLINIFESNLPVTTPTVDIRPIFPV